MSMNVKRWGYCRRMAWCAAIALISSMATALSAPSAEMPGDTGFASAAGLTAGGRYRSAGVLGLLGSTVRTQTGDGQWISQSDWALWRGKGLADGGAWSSSSGDLGGRASAVEDPDGLGGDDLPGARIVGIAMTDDGVALSWIGTLGQFYVVEAVSLAGTAPRQLAILQAGADAVRSVDGTNVFVDDRPVPVDTPIFYRIRWLGLRKSG